MKKKLFSLILFLCLFFMGGVSSFADENTTTAYTTLSTNATFTGKWFRDGWIDNYYVVQTSKNSSYAESSEATIIMYLTDFFDVENKEFLYISPKYAVKDECSYFTAFETDTRRGYEYTFMYGSGIKDKNDESDSREGQVSFPSVYGNTTLYSSDIKKLNNKSDKYDIEPGHKKAVLALVGDVAKGKVTCRQYQSLWWGQQQLWEVTTYLYFVSNFSITLKYFD